MDENKTFLDKKKDETDPVIKVEEKKVKPKKIKADAVPEVNSTEIKQFENIENALEQKNVTEDALKAMEEDFLKLTISGIDDKEGYKKVAEAQTMCRNTRVLTDEICENGRAGAILEQKAWIKKQKEINERILAVENKLKERKKAIDDAKDAIKRERETLEQKRLQERAVKLISFGMKFEEDVYVLDDIRISVIQVKTADDFTFGALLAAVEAKHKAAEEIKAQEAKLAEEAAANTKRLMEEQLAKDEELKLKERELAAREEAVKKAEAETKAKAEAEIKAKEDAEKKRIADEETAKKKAADELLKSRMSSLFAIGFSQQGESLIFKGMTIFIKDLIAPDNDQWLKQLEAHTDSVNALKKKFEEERTAEIEKAKQDAVEKERVKIIAENEAKAKAEKEKADTIAKEEARKAALAPDIDKFNTFCKAIMDVPIPEFTSPAYQAFVETIKADRVTILKNLHSKKPA